MAKPTKPGALQAALGMKKYGKQEMEKMAQVGKAKAKSTKLVKPAMKSLDDLRAKGKKMK